MSYSSPTPTGDTAGGDSSRANHMRATPTDALSWRPLQRSTRAAVSAALLAATFYVIFLLNPAYRHESWGTNQTS